MSSEGNEGVDAVYRYAAEQLDSGTSREHLESDLVSKGLDSQSAKIVVDRLTEHRLEQRKKHGQKNMALGAVWCLGGIAVTAATYSTASGGDSYLVAWGAILFGAVQFIHGLAQTSEENRP